MSRLDDLAFVTRLDPKGMWGHAVAFAQQCREAHTIATDFDGPHLTGGFSNAILVGMGGSAAGGDLVKCLFEEQSSIPFLVSREYEVPAFVGPGTLVIASSYSGNTEETLSAFEQAREKGAQIFALTSGGKLGAASQEHDIPCILIPSGFPPRAALGFMLVPVIVACEKLGLLPAQPWNQVFARLELAATTWGVGASAPANVAKHVAETLHDSLGVLYGLGSYQGAVANRWKGQINENSKNMIHSASIPEMNHNEILGWVKANHQGVASWKTWILQDNKESAKMKTRAKVLESLIKDVSSVEYITVPGDSLLERIFAMTYLGDFVSLYLAALNGVDPENIDSINTLKSELSKVP